MPKFVFQGNGMVPCDSPLIPVLASSASTGYGPGAKNPRKRAFPTVCKVSQHTLLSSAKNRVLTVREPAK